jgi:hypothetical protein
LKDKSRFKVFFIDMNELTFSILNYIEISLMNRSSISPQAKSKGKQLGRVPSAGLLSTLSSNYGDKIPVAAITAASKYYGKGRPLRKDDRTLKRLSNNGSDISAATLNAFLTTETHEKGKPLSEEAVKRIFASFANEGKLSF